MSEVAKKHPPKPGSTSTRKAGASAIDRDKLRAALRRLGDEYVFEASTGGGSQRDPRTMITAPATRAMPLTVPARGNLTRPATTTALPW